MGCLYLNTYEEMKEFNNRLAVQRFILFVPWSRKKNNQAIESDEILNRLARRTSSPHQEKTFEGKENQGFGLPLIVTGKQKE